jgi:aspartate/methionine/tyrosine aminotransferase
MTPSLGSRPPESRWARGCGVQFRPFALERYFAKYEFAVEHLLSASDPESLTLQELLALADTQSLALWQELKLAYTESQGHPLLREAIAGTYSSIDPRDVLVAVPEEAIFIAMNCLLRPGDHVIATFPAYQSLHEIAGSLGCRLTRWPLSQNGERWELDLGLLADSLADDTRLIVINFPHNPTGYLPEQATLDAILDLARRRGVYIFSDEMYRRLEYTPERRLPAVCDLYERGVSLSGLSKTFGLPGLRLGWLATADRELLASCAVFKDYTTICGSAPSEILGIMALRASERIIARNLAIIRANLHLADEFFVRQQDRFTWLRPQAGPVCLPRLLSDLSVAALCEGLLERKSVMLLPGEVFEFGDNYFRLGLGRRDFPEGLAILEAHLDGR